MGHGHLMANLDITSIMCPLSRSIRTVVQWNMDISGKPGTVVQWNMDIGCKPGTVVQWNMDDYTCSIIYLGISTVDIRTNFCTCSA